MTRQITGARNKPSVPPVYQLTPPRAAFRGPFFLTAFYELDPGEGFEAWKAYAASMPDMDVSALMKRGTPILSDTEAAAYGAPFPFPEMVMIDPSMEGVAVSRKARRWWSEAWRGQSFMAIGMQDPVLGPVKMEKLRATIRNYPAPMQIPDGGHFVQEWGAPIARAALNTFGKS